jgi:hypothetical protein
MPTVEWSGEFVDCGPGWIAIVVPLGVVFLGALLLWLLLWMFWTNRRD